MTTSRTGSLSASIATSMDIWQKNADPRRKNEKCELVSNVTRGVHCQELQRNTVNEEITSLGRIR